MHRMQYSEHAVYLQIVLCAVSDYLSQFTVYRVCLIKQNLFLHIVHLGHSIATQPFGPVISVICMWT